MCIIHYYHHSPCGHNVKNWPLSIQCHCEPVEQALRFFHDQNHYHLLDEQLSSRYGMTTGENLECPKACPARWPVSLPSPDPIHQIFPQQYWEWLHETMHQLQSSQRNSHGDPPSLPRQFRLDSVSQHKKDSGKRRGRALHLTDKTSGPYPIDQADHMIHIRQQQDRGHVLEPHLPPWNVVLHTVPWGCGKLNHPACLVGHTESNGPLCPFLLAQRIPRDHRTAISDQLADTSPNNRGGASNVPVGGDHPRQLTRAAPSFAGPNHDLVPVTLPAPFVDSLRTGVGSKGMVYWGVAPCSEPAAADRPFLNSRFEMQHAGVEAEVFYTKQPGAGPAVYMQVPRPMAPYFRGNGAAPGGDGGGGGQQQQQQQQYMTPTGMEWPVFTGGMNAEEGHYGPGAWVMGEP